MTESIIKDANVTADFNGMRVDVVLAQLFPDYSRSQLSLWLKNGEITLNNKNYKPKDKVHGGEHVKLHVHVKKTGYLDCAENIPLAIIFEDDDILIINKPSGLVVHPGAGNPTHTLVNALLHHDATLSELPRAGIVHRLDKDTTGLLIIAKNLITYTYLVRQMQAREIQRHYIALVYGNVISGGTIDTFYGRHPLNRLKMTVCMSGKQAITHFSVNKHYLGFTLLDVRLMSGRTHQIRVHMAHINHPVVGDQLYNERNRMSSGLPSSLRDSVLAFKRQALHAGFLSFIHPKTQQTLTFTAPLPDDFQALIMQLDS